MQTRRVFFRLIATATVAAALVLPAAGQRDLQRRNPPTDRDTPRGGDDVKLDTEVIELDVSVADRANRPIYDIPKERFQIYEDGSLQTIEFFKKEEVPVSLALAIDTSGSMRSKLESVVQAVTNLVHANKPQDETAVLQFKDQVELIEEFTNDSSDIEDALGDLIASGQTSLLDAIMLAADYAQKDGHRRRKALVVVSDGLEKGSYYSLEQVVEQMRKLDVRLYLVGFTSDLQDTAGLFKKSQKDKAEQLLNKLAEETGGRAFFPKDVSELGPITDQIALDLRTIFALGYYPTNSKKDGTFRKIDVKVLGQDRKPDSKVSVRTRSGYVADKE